MSSGGGPRHRTGQLTAQSSNSEPDLFENETLVAQGFDPKIPSSCSICYDFRLEKYPRTEVRDSHLGGVDEVRVVFSFKALQVQSSRGCRGCKMLYDAIRSRWKHEGYPGRVTVGFAQGKRAAVFLASNKDGSGPGDTFIMYSSLGKPCPWSAIEKVPIISPLNVLMEDRRQLLDGLLRDCLDNHAICRRTANKVMPRRLIDVGDPQKRLSLSLKEGLGKKVQYVTLSHCWKYSIGTSPAAKLLIQNVESRKSEIPWNELSKTFQDAVLIARWFKIRYLWIDSLCIIQDDKNDWAEQASHMADIYENAYFTIACEFDYGGTVEDGCFLDRERRLGEIKGYDIHGKEFSVFVSGGIQRVADYSSPDGFSLWHRGWCIQERILSTRILRFQPLDITFECSKKLACECWLFGLSSTCNFEHRITTIQAGFIHGRAVYQDESIRSISKGADTSRENVQSHTKDIESAALWSRWHTISALFLECQRSFSEIILPWHANLGSHRDEVNYVAPSFSWMSVLGRCSYDSLDLSKNALRAAEVISYRNTLSIQNPEDPLKECHICLRTRIASLRTGVYNGRSTTELNDQSDPYHFDTKEDWVKYNASLHKVLAVEILKTPLHSAFQDPSRGVHAANSTEKAEEWALLLVKSKRKENAYERVGSVKFDDLEFFQDADTADIKIV